MKRFLTVFLVALLIVAAIPTLAFAEDLVSPTPGDEPKVEVATSDANAGTVKKNELANGQWELTADPAAGHEFAGWEFEGDFEFVTGDKNSKTVVIQPKGDVKATAKFTNSTGKPGSGEGNAPQTGDHAVLIVLATIVTLAGAAFACKKVLA